MIALPIVLTLLTLLASALAFEYDQGEVDPLIDTTVEYDTDTYASTKELCDDFAYQCYDFVSQVSRQPRVAIDCVNSQPGPVVLLSCYGSSDNVEGMFDYTQNLMRFVDLSLIAGPGETVQTSSSSSSSAAPTGLPPTTQASTSGTSSVAQPTSDSTTASTQVATTTSLSTDTVPTVANGSTTHATSLPTSGSTSPSRALAVDASSSPSTALTTSSTAHSTLSSTPITLPTHAPSSGMTHRLTPAERKSIRRNPRPASHISRAKARAEAAVQKWIASGRRVFERKKPRKQYDVCRVRPGRRHPRRKGDEGIHDGAKRIKARVKYCS